MENIEGNVREYQKGMLIVTELNKLFIESKELRWDHQYIYWVTFLEAMISIRNWTLELLENIVVAMSNKIG